VRTAWIGPARAVVLVVLLVAMAADLVSLAALLARTDGAARPGRPSAADVTVDVLESVADADCAGIAGLLAPDAELPFSVRQCLDGVSDPIAIDGIEVESSAGDDRTATVLVSLQADGAVTPLRARLRRVEGRWVLTSLTSG
jgi:hypothetical protein